MSIPKCHVKVSQWGPVGLSVAWSEGLAGVKKIPDACGRDRLPSSMVTSIVVQHMQPITDAMERQA